MQEQVAQKAQWQPKSMIAEIGQVPISLDLDFSSYEGDWKHVAAFYRQRGWLLAVQATIQSEQDILSSTLVVACDDRDNVIPSWRALHLTQCSWSGLDYCYEEPPTVLDDLLCEEEGAFYARWQRSTNADLAAFYEQSQREVEALDRAVKARSRRLEHQIGVLRQRRRRPDTSVEAQIALNSVIADLEAENDNLLAEYVDQRSLLRRRAESQEELLWRRTEVLIEVEPLYIVRWRSGCPRAECDVAPKWIEGSFYAPAAPESEAPTEDADSVLAKVGAALRANAAKNTAKESEVSGGEHSARPVSQAPDVSSVKPADDKPTVGPSAVPLTVDQSNGSWTPTRLATLRQMWADGISADEIALTLGGVKRNAVIGKAYRLGLPKRLGAVEAAVSPKPPVKIVQPLPKPAIGDDLVVKRAMLAAELEDLTEHGRKFFPGSRKFLANQDARAAVSKELELLDRRMAAATAVIGSGWSDDSDGGQWSGKRVEMLKQLWLSGHTAAQIAEALGGTSRNAVISKAKRLSLPFKTQSTGETID